MRHAVTLLGLGQDYGRAADRCPRLLEGCIELAEVEPALERFESAMNRFPEVTECYLMTGEADYLLRVVVPDIVALQDFIVGRLSKTAGVANIRSSFALKQVKYKTALPLDELLGVQPTR